MWGHRAVSPSLARNFISLCYFPCLQPPVTLLFHLISVILMTWFRPSPPFPHISFIWHLFVEYLQVCEALGHRWALQFWSLWSGPARGPSRQEGYLKNNHKDNKDGKGRDRVPWRWMNGECTSLDGGKDFSQEEPDEPTLAVVSPPPHHCWRSSSEMALPSSFCSQLLTSCSASLWSIEWLPHPLACPPGWSFRLFPPKQSMQFLFSPHPAPVPTLYNSVELCCSFVSGLLSPTWKIILIFPSSVQRLLFLILIMRVKCLKCLTHCNYLLHRPFCHMLYWSKRL